MKKLLTFVAVTNLVFSSVVLGDEAADLKDFPIQAQQFVKQYAPNETIMLSEFENNDHYKIDFENGLELRFEQGNGKLRSIMMGTEEKKPININFLPKPVKTTLSKTYHNTNVLSVVSVCNLYSITLQNNKRVVIDTQGKILEETAL